MQKNRGHRPRLQAMHYLLFYEKVADHLQREIPLQAAHRAHVKAAAARG